MKPPLATGVKIIATYSPCCGIFRVGDADQGVMHCALPHEQKTIRLADAAQEVHRLRGMERGKQPTVEDMSLRQMEANGSVPTPTIENLLAVIHRDGGHHTINAGLERSIADAAQEVNRLRGMEWHAHVILRQGRFFLVVNGLFLAMQGDPCRDSSLTAEKNWTYEALQAAAREINQSYREPRQG